MKCPNCENVMEEVDTTYSAITTERAIEGQQTGIVYYCEDCGQHFIENFLTGKVETWNY